MHPTEVDKWLKKATSDDTGLTRPPAVVRVSGHKDEVQINDIITDISQVNSGC